MRLREVKGHAQGTKASRWLSQESHPDRAGPRPAPASETQQPSSQHVPLRVCRPALGLPTVAGPFPFLGSPSPLPHHETCRPLPGAATEEGQGHTGLFLQPHEGSCPRREDGSAC